MAQIRAIQALQALQVVKVIQVMLVIGQMRIGGIDRLLIYYNFLFLLHYYGHGYMFINKWVHGC